MNDSVGVCLRVCRELVTMVRDNINVVFILLDESFHQIFPSLDLCYLVLYISSTLSYLNCLERSVLTVFHHALLLLFCCNKI
jgi:hypothetical protein